MDSLLAVLADPAATYTPFFHPIHKVEKFRVYLFVSGFVQIAFEDTALHSDAIVFQLFCGFSTDLIDGNIIYYNIHPFRLFPLCTRAFCQQAGRRSPHDGKMKMLNLQ